MIKLEPSHINSEVTWQASIPKPNQGLHCKCLKMTVSFPMCVLLVNISQFFSGILQAFSLSHNSYQL